MPRNKGKKAAGSASNDSSASGSGSASAAPAANNPPPQPSGNTDLPPAYGFDTNTGAEATKVDTVGFGEVSLPPGPATPPPTATSTPPVSKEDPTPAAASGGQSQATPSEKNKDNNSGTTDNAATATTQPDEGSSKTKGPTIDDPFAFPSDPPPSYAAVASSSSSAQAKGTPPIAIPQSAPSAPSPFLSAYAPALLARGVPSSSFLSFLSTLSAFLSARVSERAVAHATDVARRVGDHPAGFARRLANHARNVSKGVVDDARGGNLIGAAFKLVGGAISLPVHAAVGTAATAVSLPGMAIGAVMSKPQTPRARAEAYLVVANKDWLGARGLSAAILDSRELSDLVGASVTSVAEAAKADAKKEGSDVEAGIQLKGLRDYISELEVQDKSATLQISDDTLWLVIREVGAVGQASAVGQTGAESSQTKQ